MPRSGLTSEDRARFDSSARHPKVLGPALQVRADIGPCVWACVTTDAQRHGRFFFPQCCRLPGIGRAVIT